MELNVIKAIIFFVSLALSIFFFGRLVSWAVHNISDTKKVTNSDIAIANWAMIVACVGWTILYYSSLQQ